MNTPTLSPQETQDHAVFMALMWALSQPGEVQTIAVGDDYGLEGIRTADSAWPSLEAVGKALLDLETSFFTPDPALLQTFTRLGARAESPEKAAYQFFPLLDETALETIAQASVGTLLYPDHAATIVVVGELGKGPKLHLRGPGIKDVNEIRVDLPQSFWSLRDQKISFPLGWDVLLISGQGKLIGVPRSSKVEVI